MGRWMAWGQKPTTPSPLILFVLLRFPFLNLLLLLLLFLLLIASKLGGVGAAGAGVGRSDFSLCGAVIFASAATVTALLTLVVGAFDVRPPFSALLCRASTGAHCVI